jgi:uncharacterized protein DUF6510
MSPTALDGNAVAGDLADIFAVDITTATTTCAACHDAHPVAALLAYVQSPGIVLRCTSCTAVQIRYVRSAERAWLDLRGVEVLEMPVADAER